VDKKQQIQNEQYNYPYHYIPFENEGRFSQTQHWSWGFRYLGGLNVVLDQLKEINFSSLIDVGCGDGRFLKEVGEQYPYSELIGVDYSERAINIAKAMNPQITYDAVNILHDSIDRSFDIATAIEVLEHIPPKSLPQFVGAISEIINDGGYFILTVPHENKRVSEKHYQHFTSAKLKNLLSPHFKNIDFIPFDTKSHLLGLLSKIIGGKGNHFVITNQKINNWFFNLYRKRYLYTNDVSKCLRIAAVCQK
jgi:2-polyprenyl-3-methyl-5-hydroxy-6-metoxy-1,4-benzoquinol methylase